MLHIRKRLAVLLLFISSNTIAQYDSNLFQSESLSEQWEFTADSNKTSPFLHVSAYKPLYVLFANHTSNINTLPVSRNAKNTASSPLNFTATEVKYQLSFKVKTANNLLGKKLGGSLWVTYTQSSRWQLYNGELSRPFRESNYEPEVLLIIPTKFKIWKVKGVFAGVGINHQSNGRERPYSRSWNRIIIHSGYEINKLNITARYWWRIYEQNNIDDNPGIDYYIGNTEFILSYTKGKHKISLTERHNLRFKETPRGSIQLDYSLRTFENLKLHFQFFYGYGESMIDFNHKQTTFGIGVSF